MATRKKQKANLRLVNGVTLAKEVGVSRQHISRLYNKGILPRDEKGLYDLEKCQKIIQGRRQFDKDRDYKNGIEGAPDEIDPLVDPRRAAEYWKAKTAELEFYEKQGKLVNLEDVIKANVYIARNITTRVLAIAHKAAPILVGKRKKEIYAILIREAEEALNELAKMETAANGFARSNDN